MKEKIPTRPIWFRLRVGSIKELDKIARQRQQSRADVIRSFVLEGILADIEAEAKRRKKE